MISFLVQGGVVLIPILALSVIAVALIIQKSVFFIHIRNRSEDLGTYVIEALRSGRAKLILSELEQMSCPEARVLMAG